VAKPATLYVLVKELLQSRGFLKVSEVKLLLECGIEYDWYEGWLRGAVGSPHIPRTEVARDQRRGAEA